MRTTNALLAFALSLYMPVAAISQDAVRPPLLTPTQFAARTASNAFLAISDNTAVVAPAIAAPLHADSSEPSLKDLLATMVRRSGIIVAGDISNVASRCLPLGSIREGALVTEITIRATASIRGVMPGQSFTFRNAASGCDPDALAYRVGDHLILMLEPMDPMGVSAPVDGAIGVIHIDADGNASLTGLHTIITVSETALLRQLSQLAAARVPTIALARR